MRYDKTNTAHFLRDETLKQRTELFPAFLAWVVKGAIEWYDHGLGSVSDCCSATKREFAAANDKVQTWLDNSCEVGEGRKTVTTDAWRSFDEEQRGASDKMLKKDLFGELLRKGFSKTRWQKQDDFSYYKKEVFLGFDITG